MALIMKKVKGGKIGARFANIDKIVDIVDEVQNLYLTQMTRIELASRNSDVNEDIFKRKVERCVEFGNKKVVINDDYTVSFYIRNTPIKLLSISARYVQIFREMIEYILEYIKEFKIEVTTEDELTEEQVKKFKQRYNRCIHLNKRVDNYCSTHKAIDFEDFRDLF